MAAILDHLASGQAKVRNNTMTPPARRCIYLLGYLCGLRHKEIRLLQMRDHDLDAQTVTVRLETEKATRGATLPLAP